MLVSFNQDHNFSPTYKVVLLPWQQTFQNPNEAAILTQTNNQSPTITM